MGLIITTGSEKQDQVLKEVARKAGHVIAKCNSNEKELLGKTDQFDTVILGWAAASTMPNMERVLYNLCSQRKRVILLVKEKVGSLVRLALSLGIYDILVEPVSPDKVIELLAKPNSFHDVCKLLDPQLQDGSITVTKPIEMQTAVNWGNNMQHHTAVFWSANGCEGKTTLVASFAKRLAAQTGQEVAIADFKEITPHLHKVFGVELISKKTIAESIATNETSPARLADWLQRVGPNLWLLSGFDINEFHLLGIEGFKILLHLLQHQYPYVVVEVNSGIAFAGTVAGLSLAERVFVPVLPTLNSVHDTRALLGFMASKWNLDLNKVHAVLNRVRFGAEVDISVARSLLPVETVGVIKENNAMQVDSLIGDFLAGAEGGELSYAD